MATKLCEENLGSFSCSDLRFCPFYHLKKTETHKGDMSIKGHNSFKGNVLISVKASEISPNVEEGFDMNPSSCG